jgi:hypothetical protein
MIINKATEKKENDISVELKDLLLYLEHAHQEDDVHEHETGDAPFFLGQISERAGKLYEKVRAAVDNKEEHFLRRYAIRRIAKRIMWFSDDPKVITGRLLRELYKTGYLPEDRISRHTEEDIVHTVSTFLALSDGVAERVTPGEFLALRKHLLDIIAGAIEDRLYPTYFEESVVRLLARLGHEHSEIEGFGATKELLPHYFYIASWKALFAADRELLIYKLWLLEYPEWDHQDDNSLTLVAHGFSDFISRAGVQSEHPLVGKLVPKLRNYSVAITVLYELIERYGKGIVAVAADRGELLLRSEEIILQKYKSDIARAGRKSWNAVVYILATKAALAGMVETAYVTLLKQKLSLVPLLINIFFHPVLLYAMTSKLSVPDRKNTDRLLSLLSSIVYGGDLPLIRVVPSRFGLIGDIATALYLVALTLILYGITQGLLLLDFHVIDIIFFILFFALILYFAFRVRYGSRRMELSGKKESFLRSFLELLMLPVVSLGRFLVTRFEKINIVAIFMDFFIELPLKLVLEFFDAFSRVIKEKKDEIYS